MANYAPRYFKDKDSLPLDQSQFNASVTAIRSIDNATTSSVITMTHDTTALEVTTAGVPAFLKWIRTGDTGASIISAGGATANFDVAVPANWNRSLVVPVEAIVSLGQSNTASMVGINRANGLYQRYAVKTAGIGSVMVVEYGY